MNGNREEKVKKSFAQGWKDWIGEEAATAYSQKG